MSDFREVNKRIARNPFPIPKMSTVLQELEGFTYMTALDLNMGYYIIRLDPDSSKTCTIIFLWGKYSYLRLPMGIACSPDIFQAKMSELMVTLEFFQAYIDDLLCITRAAWAWMIISQSWDKYSSGSDAQNWRQISKMLLLCHRNRLSWVCVNKRRHQASAKKDKGHPCAHMAMECKTAL